MSTENIFGSWNNARLTGDAHHDRLQWMWHKLASQNEGTPDAQVNNGLTQRKAEIQMLWSLYLMSQPRVVLEVGTAQGGTAASWLQLGRDDLTFIAIDRCLDDSLPRPGEPVHKDIYSGPLKMYSQGGGIHHLKKPNQTVVGISGWTHEESTIQQLLGVLGGRKVDFMFHDASHKMEKSAADFQIFWPLIAEGGAMAFHDINWSADLNCDKKIEWDRIRREETYSACYEFLPSRETSEMGIGVLLK